MSSIFILPFFRVFFFRLPALRRIISLRWMVKSQPRCSLLTRAGGQYFKKKERTVTETKEPTPRIFSSLQSNFFCGSLMAEGLSCFFLKCFYNSLKQHLRGEMISPLLDVRIRDRRHKFARARLQPFYVSFV